MNKIKQWWARELLRSKLDFEAHATPEEREVMDKQPWRGSAEFLWNHNRQWRYSLITCTIFALAILVLAITDPLS